MKDYFGKKRHKKSSYLYYGIVTALIAAAMVVLGITFAVKDESVWSVAARFAAAAVWGVTAALSFYFYKDANRDLLNSDDEDSRFI